jgi:hypothetical protein
MTAQVRYGGAPAQLHADKGVRHEALCDRVG